LAEEVKERRGMIRFASWPTNVSEKEIGELLPERRKMDPKMV
jgi:hypothetical protein